MDWAAENGIVSSYGGNFDPDAPITREQLAVMLYSCLKYRGYAMPSDAASAFTDEDSISPWALDAVRAIKAMGIVTGKPGSLYDPQATATRAEAATIFVRFVEALAK